MIAAIVPAKPRALSKTRLSPAFDPDIRRHLHDRLLDRTLLVLTRSPEIGTVYLIGGDVLDGRWSDCIVHIADPGDGLNAGVSHGLKACLADGWNAALVVPIDLPLIDNSAIKQLTMTLDSNPAGNALIIVPDRHGEGTNALLIRPPDLLRPEYGPDSFRRHVQQARATGATVVVADIPQLHLDLDRPEDVALLPAGVRDALLAPMNDVVAGRQPEYATSRGSR